jgi:putative membrane protein
MIPNRAKWIAGLGLSLFRSVAYAVTLNAFMEEAAQQSVCQTESAKVALQKSQSQEVKDFAHQIIASKALLYGKLKTLGEQLHMNVPTEASLTGKAKQMRLESREDSFDRIYIDSQVRALEQQVFLFKKEAMSSEKPELKWFAESALPDILKQERTVKSLQDKLKPSAGRLRPTKP